MYRYADISKNPIKLLKIDRSAHDNYFSSSRTRRSGNHHRICRWKKPMLRFRNVIEGQILKLDEREVEWPKSVIEKRHLHFKWIRLERGFQKIEPKVFAFSPCQYHGNSECCVILRANALRLVIPLKCNKINLESDGLKISLYAVIFENNSKIRIVKRSVREPFGNR